MSRKLQLIIPVAFLLPLLASAQSCNAGGLCEILNTIKGLLDAVIPIIMVLALIYFFWGLAKFILNSGDEEKRSEGKSIMIYGIIALFVMVAVWGLVDVLARTFSIDQGGGPKGIPGVPDLRLR